MILEALAKNAAPPTDLTARREPATIAVLAMLGLLVAALVGVLVLRWRRRSERR